MDGRKHNVLQQRGYNDSDFAILTHEYRNRVAMRNSFSVHVFVSAVLSAFEDSKDTHSRVELHAK